MFSCRNMGYKNESFRIMNRAALSLCKFCDSGNVKKWGMRRTKRGTVQTFKCLEYGRRYSINFGFEKMRYSSEVITQSLQMYYSKMSTRRISQYYAMFGIDVSHMIIYNWVAKFSELVADYLNDIIPRTADRAMVKADEVFIKFSGVMHYVFSSMDDDTRFWLAAEVAGSKFQHNADNLLKMTRKK